MTNNIIQSYAGVEPPAFLIVEKVQFSVLPSSDIQQLDVLIRNGSYFFSQTHGARTFTAEIIIKSDSRNGVMYDSDELASWLFHDSPQPLIFRDKPNISYYAIVDNNIDIASFSNSGRGKFHFYV